MRYDGWREFDNFLYCPSHLLLETRSLSSIWLFGRRYTPQQKGFLPPCPVNWWCCPSLISTPYLLLWASALLWSHEAHPPATRSAASQIAYAPDG